MRRIVYYVATSIDGFISGPQDDISGFIAQSEGIDQYLADLQQFDTVLMGRKTYEFGYNYGLQPGKAPYPHMNNYIFSKSLKFEFQDKNVTVGDWDIDFVKFLKQQPGTDIYLCGGGKLAAWLLENELIDILKIKLNPFIQGRGIKLFNTTKKNYQLNLQHQKTYKDDLLLLTYLIQYE